MKSTNKFINVKMGTENIQCNRVYQLLILFIDDKVKPIAENGIFCGFIRMR
jgi:hypothetical protein